MACVAHIKKDLQNKGLTVKIKGVKRNSDGEITAIKIDAKSENSNSNYSIKSDEGIAPITISYNASSDSISIGNSNDTEQERVFIYRATHLVLKTLKMNNIFYLKNLITRPVKSILAVLCSKLIKVIAT